MFLYGGIEELYYYEALKKLSTTKIIQKCN